MDLDSLERQFRDLKRRVEPMLADYEAYKAERIGARTPRAALHEAARSHLEDGRLDAAGGVIGLDRSHDGNELDDSYSRRLRAELLGEAALKPVSSPSNEDEKNVDGDEADDPAPQGGPAKIKPPAPNEDQQSG